MFKHVFFAAGMLVATLVSSHGAQASAHRAYYGHRGAVAAHGQHLGRARMAGRLRAGGRRYAQTAHYGTRIRGARRYGRIGLSHRGYASAHRAYRHYARRGARYAAVPRDTQIQNYVGPATTYAPASTPVATGGQVGGASYYSGGRTASGGSVGAATCAHRWLPFGTRVLVTNLNNARQAVLTVNDRGPFIGGRIVDVSRTAAGTLGMLGSGVARVSLKVIGGPG